MALDNSETSETGIPMAVRTARELAERAGSYLQEQLGHLFDAGRPFEDRVADIKEFVRTHPLQALAATIGIGYILGKLTRR